ncbi:MAG: epoxyqueuosine reductase QueH [Deltaproteobacteria bacterium]
MTGCSSNSKVLLHVCCGVCAGWPAAKLRADGYDVTCFFYNPNVTPKEEYDRRRDAARKAAEAEGFAFIEGPYDHERWLEHVHGLEGEPEGGQRCVACYRLRLSAALARAGEISAGSFATTLTVSPHKNAEIINAVGTSLSAHGFLPYNFKKQDGFRRTCRFADSLSLYRQDYCGCLYSKR